MDNKKAFFHDRIVLLFLSINAFLVAFCIASIVLRLGDPSEGYIVQYRGNLGLDAYRAGPLYEILSFIPFAIIVYLTQLLIGIKMYEVKKVISRTILMLATLVLLLSVIVSYALLTIR